MKTTPKNEAAPQKKLSIPTIVVLIVGGALIVYMLVQPLVTPKAPRPDNSVTTARTANNPARPNPKQAAPGSTATVVPDRAALADVSLRTKKGELISDRDPFMPSSVLIRAAVEPKPAPAPAAFPERSPAPTIVKTQPETTPAPPDRFTWKGVVGNYGEHQVLIIQHNARSYILHQGESVPGTKYIVAEVTPDMVVLTAPDKQLRLSRKKEAKTNGKK